jgi:hypothetical protein
MTHTAFCVHMTITRTLMRTKDKFGDSFGTAPHLSTGVRIKAELSQNNTGKLGDLNTVFAAS